MYDLSKILIHPLVFHSMTMATRPIMDIYSMNKYFFFNVIKNLVTNLWRCCGLDAGCCNLVQHLKEHFQAFGDLHILLPMGASGCIPSLIENLLKSWRNISAALYCLFTNCLAVLSMRRFFLYFFCMNNLQDNWIMSTVLRRYSQWPNLACVQSTNYYLYN